MMFPVGPSNQNHGERWWPGKIASSGRLSVKACFVKVLYLPLACSGEGPPRTARLFAGHDAEVGNRLIAHLQLDQAALDGTVTAG